MPTTLTAPLKRGDTGAQVRLLQTMLNAVRGAKLDVDGSFGPAVEKAVVAAHIAWGIAAPHTVVGPGFRTKINAEWAKYNAPAPAPKPDPTPIPAPTPAKTLDDVHAVLVEILQEVKK